MTKNIQKIYPLLKCINVNYLKNRVEARETSRGKVREIVGLSAPTNKAGIPTYLSNENESLIYSYDEIEGGYGLPLDSTYLLEQLQRVINAVFL